MGFGILFKYNGFELCCMYNFLKDVLGRVFNCFCMNFRDRVLVVILGICCEKVLKFGI